MTDATQIETWTNEALALAGNTTKAEALVRRIYDASAADRRREDADTIAALEGELARLRRATVTAGS